MTFGDLYRQCIDIEDQLKALETGGNELPLKFRNRNVDITLELKDGYVEFKFQRKRVTPQEFKSIINNK